MRRIAPMVIALFGLATAGDTASAAMDAGRGSDATPVTSLDGGYFSGEGFESHPERYAAQPRQTPAVADDKSASPTILGDVTGHRFTPVEDVYFSGAGFVSESK